MAHVHDPATLEHLLLYLCREASALRRELDVLADELSAGERRRFEGTLDDIESRSQALLFAMPDRAAVN